MPHELRLVDRDVLDSDAALVATDIDDAVDHQKRIAVRQRLENGGNIGRLECGPGDSHFPHPHSLSCARPPLLSLVSRSSVATSRSHCLPDLAGYPAQRAPDGTLLMTPALAPSIAPAPT